MEKSIIDIGSNSVRLYLPNTDLGKKYIESTMLAQGMLDGFLRDDAMKRTVDAVEKLLIIAKNEGFETPNVFATEAVRSAKNQKNFVRLLLNATGIDLHILSGEEEAKVAFLGATEDCQGYCSVIDIGGASVEYAYGKGTTLIYSKSLPIGTIAIKNTLADERCLINSHLQSTLPSLNKKKIADYLLGVGGTLTSLASMDLRLEAYNPQKIHGHKLTLKALKILENIIFSCNDITTKFKTISPKRAEIIKQGILITINILSYFEKQEIIISEKDNLEGYLLYKNM